MIGELEISMPSCHGFKAVLVNPYHPEWGHGVPLGIAYLASVLEVKNIEVEVIDMCAYGMHCTELRETLNKCNANLVGISATTPQIPIAFEIAKLVKEISPSCKVVFGGVHPTSLPDESLNNPYVDFVVRGEGEFTLLELVCRLCSDGDMNGIKGLSYKMGNGIVHNPPRPLIDNLDNLPYPARHLFHFPDAYYSPMVKGKIFADIYTSRGCTGTCLFCNHSIFGYSFRVRSPENVLGEIEFLMDRYGIDEFHIADDCFSYDIERAIRICDMIIGNKLNIAISCSGGLRVDCVTSELLERLRLAGCYRIHFGVESGSEEILRKIGKNITLQQVRDVVAMAREAGIMTVALFMLGNYGENKQTMEETIAFAKSLDADFCQFTMATPFPGSPFYRILDKHGLLLISDWSRYDIYGETVFKTDELDGRLIAKMYRRAYRQLYLNPSFIWKKCKTIKNWSDAKVAFGGARKVIRRALVG